MSNNDVYISKSLSWLLRHAATREGLKVAPDGYIRVDEVLRHRKLRGCSVEDVRRIVADNDKQRFALRTDEHGVLHIKANQGHSLQCVADLQLEPIESADGYQAVVHGTYFRSWEAIKRTGLSRMRRQHVHFAAGLPGDGAVVSGMRSDCQVRIYVDLRKTLRDGLKFFRSPNGVILSPGDENGLISAKYFSKVIDVKTGEELKF